MPKPPTVLSIQSEVVRGHVGNGAARFALQRISVNVWAVPTVLLSNHPGHGAFTGEAVAPARIAALIDGLDRHGWLADCGAILSGYLGDAGQACVVADAVARVKRANPKALYLCDPVFGDEGGAYAKAGVAEAIARDLLPLADIVTPNRFELSSLTSKKIHDAQSALIAAQALGARETVITSIPFAAGIGTIAVADAGVSATSAPRLENPPYGSGDLLAALYLGRRLKGAKPEQALLLATSAVDAVLRASVAAKVDEMTLIASQDELDRPSQLLALQRLPA